MSTKSQSYAYEFETLIRTIEVYNLISEDDKNVETLTISDEDDSYKVFKDVSDTKTSYNIFIGNIHIRMETSAKENVYSIHIKKKVDDWVFPVENNIVNHSCPLTQTYRVFVYYDVPVLNITRAVGNTYVHGTWDKYVYKTVDKLIGIVNNSTETNQFINEYR